MCLVERFETIAIVVELVYEVSRICNNTNLLCYHFLKFNPDWYLFIFLAGVGVVVMQLSYSGF